MVNWLPKLKRLNRLRSLQLQYQTNSFEIYNPSSKTLKQEQKACDELRIGSCPDIARVCFNPGMVWRFNQLCDIWEKEGGQGNMPLVLVEI